MHYKLPASIVWFKKNKPLPLNAMSWAKDQDRERGMKRLKKGGEEGREEGGGEKRAGEGREGKNEQEN